MLPIITALLPVLGNIIEKIIPNKAEQEKAKAELALKLAEQELELAKLFAANDQGQLEINKSEAQSNSLFVSGWRPGVAWVCAFAFGWSYVIQPFLVFVFAAAGHPVAGLPELNLGEMMPVLMGILGLGGLRSWEKKIGVARK